MHTDSYFQQGVGHAKCEDYAINGENEQIAYCLVADGCSSSPKTDVGARLVAEAFVRSAAEIFSPKFSLFGCPTTMIQVDTLGRLKAIKDMLALSSNSFDSTLLAVVYEKKENKCHLFLWGDGFAKIDYEGYKELWHFDYRQNAPYYLSYLLNPERLKAYLTEFPDNKCDLTRYTQLDSGMCGDEREVLTPFYHRLINTDKLKTISLFSDGFGTYSKLNDDKEVVPIPYRDMVLEASGYKSTVGNFVQRRMLALAKNSAKLGRGHYDDVSAAAISFV